MEKILNHSNENFITLLDKFISKNRSPDRNIADQVKSIISDVETNGDKAISELTLKYDDKKLSSWNDTDRTYGTYGKAFLEIEN